MRAQHGTHEAGKDGGVSEGLRPEEVISGAEHVAPMKGPPVEGEHWILRPVDDNAGAQALEGDEAKCRPNKREQLQGQEQKQHGREGPKGIDDENEHNEDFNTARAERRGDNEGPHAGYEAAGDWVHEVMG